MTTASGSTGWWVLKPGVRGTPTWIVGGVAGGADGGLAAGRSGLSMGIGWGVGATRTLLPSTCITWTLVGCGGVSGLDGLGGSSAGGAGAFLPNTEKRGRGGVGSASAVTA